MSHSSKIKDTETHFIIDPSTRTVTNASSSNNIIVQYDHNSERFTFEMPRYGADGHDMLESTEVRVQYINSASTGLTKTPGVYICDDLVIDPEDENLVTFSWLLSSAATQYIGFLYFSIQFVCLNGDEVEYAWNTGIYKDIVIIESINNGENAMTNNVDALIAYRNTIIEQVSAGITNGRIGYVDILADKWVGSSSPYSQVVQIEGVTENTQVDLTPSVEQLVVFHDKDLAFVTANTGGTVTVYAVGQKPANSYNIQVTMKEVVTESKTIIGVTVGTTLSLDKIDKDLAHIANKNNPHGVTIEQIGAAPSGRGLGETVGKDVSGADFNTITENGWYSFGGGGSNMPTPDLGYSHMLVAARNSDNLTQFVFQSNVEVSKGTIIKRTKWNGVWGEWEWVNPPMVAGVEYRTTERYNGKPVYTQAVDFGKLPASAYKEVTFTNSSVEGVVELNFFVSYDGMYRSLERIGGVADCNVARFSDRSSLRVTTNQDLSMYNTIITVKYIKD